MFNKKICLLVLSGICLFAPYANANVATDGYARTIYLYASTSNVSGIQRLTNNYGIDALDKNGNTALCYAINNNDIKTYKALMKMGAKSHNYCMKKLSKTAKQSFEKSLNAYEMSTTGRYNEHGTLLTRTKIAEPSTLSTSTKFGIGLGAVALVGGAVAAAGGGGGGGGSGSDSSSDNTHMCERQGGTIINGECILLNNPGASPRNAKKQNYHTKEYNSSATFLSSIKADSAYARGYTGYIINRDENGYLVDNGSGFISNQKVKVGVLDNGFDIYHPDLINNIVKKFIGINKFIDKDILLYA